MKKSTVDISEEDWPIFSETIKRLTEEWKLKARGIAGVMYYLCRHGIKNSTFDSIYHKIKPCQDIGLRGGLIEA